MNYSITLGAEKHPVSDLQFGLFLEDINWACDGGLNANMVQNHSFDGIYVDRTATEDTVTRREKVSEHFEPLRFWQITGGQLTSAREGGYSSYAVVTLDSEAVLTNRGYDGGQRHTGSCGMNFNAGESYCFTCWIRTDDFAGTVEIFGADADGHPVTAPAPLPLTGTWTEISVSVLCNRDAYGQLVIRFRGKGSVQIDCITFMNENTWGKNDPKWSGGHFRKDLVEALAELKPKFLRFPGGCITEGMYPGNEYNWKDSVGRLIDRKGIPNLWTLRTKDKSYFQSYQIGFYEYFCLCEDLGMEPLPVVWAGHTCQFRSDEKLMPEDEGFTQRVIDSAIDLVEFANGDPDANPWAKLRAEMGHPAPFGLKLISIGNENWGADYFRAYAVAQEAVARKYPYLTFIFSAGPFMLGKEREEAWAVALEKYPDAMMDEHFYQDKSWVYDHVHVYDGYPRKGPKVFLGEYAAFNMSKPHDTNTFASALAEAAYLTGVERNTDIVTMTSYAPLFCMAGGEQWNHDMIFFNHKHVLKTTNYFVQQMYSNNIGTHSVEITEEKVPGFYTSATEDADFVYIKLVNHTRRQINVTIRAESGKLESAEMTVLHSAIGSAKNKLAYEGESEYNVVPHPGEVVTQNGTVSAALSPNTFAVIRARKG